MGAGVSGSAEGCDGDAAYLTASSPNTAMPSSSSGDGGKNGEYLQIIPEVITFIWDEIALANKRKQKKNSKTKK